MTGNTLPVTGKAIEELKGLRATPLSLESVDSRYRRVGEIEDACLTELDTKLLTVQGKRDYRNLEKAEQAMLETYSVLLREEKSRLRGAIGDAKVVQDAYSVLARRWEDMRPGEDRPSNMVVYSVSGGMPDGIWDIVRGDMALPATKSESVYFSSTNRRKTLVRSPLWLYILLERDARLNNTEHHTRSLVSEVYENLTAAETELVAVLWDTGRGGTFNDLNKLVDAAKKLT